MTTEVYTICACNGPMDIDYSNVQEPEIDIVYWMLYCCGESAPAGS